MRDIYNQPVLPAYDYVVIGSGSAGSVMAARLAEQSDLKVLLLEAGPKDDSIFIKMPAALGFPLMNDKFNWYMNSEVEPSLDGRTVHEARGRVLGGSSSINGMNWVRGNPWDYDNWGKLGLEGWSYAECLPYFRRSESFDKGGNAWRGGNGPMHIETCRVENPMYHAFLEAGVQAGYARIEDHNAFRQEGVHITQRNVHQGLRWNTSRGYLHNQARKPNLQVCDRSIVQNIEFVGTRATKIHFTWHGEKQTIRINSEVILCAGAIHSPHLLMLSGVGNADHLKALGLKSVMHLPGVGENLKDHTAAPVQYTGKQNVSLARNLTPLGRLKLGAQWQFFKKGLGATNFFEVGAFIRTRDEIQIPNVQFEFIPMLGEFQHGSVKLEDGFQYFFSLMRPTSTGRVWLDSANPASAPKFQFNFLSTEEDCEDTVAAVKAIRNVVSQKAWDPFRGEEVTPGADVKTDAQILDMMRKLAGTNYHPSCTCKMGIDDMSVTDAQARVHGLENVRVVDASIMPEIVSGNLNAPVIMMAEKVADMVLNRKPLRDEKADYYLPA